MVNIFDQLVMLYGKNANDVQNAISLFIIKYQHSKPKKWISEQDIVLITYGDSITEKGQLPLVTLKKFLDKFVKNKINVIHLLPMFPYSSDDGFSVIDYKAINPNLGTWENIQDLSNSYDLMFDAVINHISVLSEWFKGYLKGNETYANYFIECDDSFDYHMVTRPRALPLCYPFKTNTGIKNIWATFSNDQVDLNYKNSSVLFEILDILIMYANSGARFIRLDAIGFIWKKLGTTCMHLPETHALIQVIHAILEECVPGTILISETNVPHKENLSYLGNGFNEAQMVYQFPLPPLTLFSFLSGKATKLIDWARSLELTPLSSKTSYFNFLASHDGIGLRPVDAILSDLERQLLLNNIVANGGKISYKLNQDGSKSPYELNINYQDALYVKGDSDKIRISKFLASQSILLTIIGVPGIYIHSLLGSRNDYEGLQKSSINRRINREKLDYDELILQLKSNSDRNLIFYEYLKMIEIRKSESAFSPIANQKVIDIHESIFAYIRENIQTNESILVMTNVSSKRINVNFDFSGLDIISGIKYYGNFTIEPYQYLWLKHL
ncbi:MAG: sugar phosphorylase [Candidatus Izemoplasmatales bacterium]|nr:sugar phosphorylase [Candidatus Izemoplasmatales bacterium]